MNAEWKPLYRFGGAAALLAGVLFRRNLAAEIALLTGRESPAAVSDWFALLQSNRLLALVYLNVFDLANYALVALLLLALGRLLGHAHRSAMMVATVSGLMGIVVYMASNTAFSMVALSDQYAAATTEGQRTSLLAAGEAVLALGRFTAPGSHPGAGGYASLLLVAVAGMIISAVMLRSQLFNRVTAVVGVLASALDLGYCIGFAALPGIDTELLALVFIPAAGFLWMVWHILVGWRLTRLGRARAG